jgi:serine/threonine protein kinase
MTETSAACVPPTLHVNPVLFCDRRPSVLSPVGSNRDIKPENCLLDGTGSLKLADFGAAVHAPSPHHIRTTRCGTPEYLAPEVVKGKGYGHAVDVWACGVLMHELTVGCTPFKDADPDRVYANIAGFTGLHHLPARRLSAEAVQLMTSLLATDPKQRPSPDAAAAHPWFGNSC